MTTTSPWIRVTKKDPCPICKHTRWCGIGEKFICCMWVESPKPAANGNGWLHPIDGERIAPIILPKPVKETVQEVNFDAMMIRWKANTRKEWLDGFAISLGVTVNSLELLGCQWAPEHRAWAFPMRSAHGKIIGIRLRNMDGKKWAIKGSRQGLFIPEELVEYLTRKD